MNLSFYGDSKENWLQPVQLSYRTNYSSMSSEDVQATENKVKLGSKYSSETPAQVGNKPTHAATF